MKSKQRHQVKSSWYYVFWGTATISVLAGQLYVGSGYRRMAKSIEFAIWSRENRHRIFQHIDPWDRITHTGGSKFEGFESSEKDY